MKISTRIALTTVALALSAGVAAAAPAADNWENLCASCHGLDGKEKMKAFKGELSAEEVKDLVAFIRKFKG